MIGGDGRFCGELFEQVHGRGWKIDPRWAGDVGDFSDPALGRRVCLGTSAGVHSVQSVDSLRLYC